MIDISVQVGTDYMVYVVSVETSKRRYSEHRWLPLDTFWSQPAHMATWPKVQMRWIPEDMAQTCLKAADAHDPPPHVWRRLNQWIRRSASVVHKAAENRETALEKVTISW